MAINKDRVINLQRQVRIAQTALERIQYDHASNPTSIAENALTEIWKLDPKQSLQGIVGHERQHA